MEDMKQEFVQKLIGFFYKLLSSSKVFILTHFIAMGVRKSTVYRLWYEEGMDETRRVGSRWEASWLRMLKQHIRTIFSPLDNDFCQRLFNGPRTKVQVAADNGVLPVIWTVSSLITCWLIYIQKKTPLCFTWAGWDWIKSQFLVDT